jgi:polyhydroxyalkanoate synthesis regulator phasin
MVKGIGIKATKVSDNSLTLGKQPAGVAKRYGNSVKAALDKASAKGSKLNKTALLAALTVKGSKLTADKAKKIVDKVFADAKSNKITVANPKKNRTLVDMATLYNLPSGNPTDGMTKQQIADRAARIRANAEAMLGNKSNPMTGAKELPADLKAQFAKMDADRATLRKATDAEIGYIVAQGKKENGNVPATGTLEKRANLRVDVDRQTDELKAVTPTDKQVMSKGFELADGQLGKMGTLSKNVLNGAIEIGQMSKDTFEALKAAAPYNRSTNKPAGEKFYLTSVGEGDKNEVVLTPANTRGRVPIEKNRIDIVKDAKTGKYDLL